MKIKKVKAKSKSIPVKTESMNAKYWLNPQTKIVVKTLGISELNGFARCTRAYYLQNRKKDDATYQTGYADGMEKAMQTLDEKYNKRYIEKFERQKALLKAKPTNNLVDSNGRGYSNEIIFKKKRK